ncbi:hypothetical protein [Cohnella sp.]|uniref:hypothetical protein n=1 Tax=Cohnella sp. TaxID=1883426 RepID=UPI0035689AB4
MNIDETGVETLEQYYEKVQEGKAQLINAEAERIYEINTRGLLPGRYALRIWQGVNVWFDIQPSLDQTPPDLTVPVTTIDIRDILYLSTDELSDIFWVPEETALDINSLEAAVANGEGGVQRNFIGTDLYATFIHISDARVGKWLLVAADGAGNLSAGITITVAEHGTSNPNVVFLEPVYNSLAIVFFNKKIKANFEIGELKSAITISRDNGATYQPLQPFENIFIDIDRLKISLNDFNGSNLRIKIAAGAIEDEYGNELAQDYISPPFSAGVEITFVGPNYVAAGNKFSIKSDREGPVFLMKSGKYASSLDDYYDMVSKGEAILIDVKASDINKAIEVDTSGLVKGEYILKARKGLQLSLYISVTPLDADQIQIENNRSDNDVVTVSHVEAGDVIRFYDVKLNTGELIVRTEIVPEGQTSLTITDMELKVEGGYLIVTNTKPNFDESPWVTIQYPSALDITPEPIPIPAPVPVPLQMESFEVGNYNNQDTANGVEL